ncbi:beta-lactamase [Aspergillus sclerotioniger CBS 115572]|uniref:Beta-lactamase n=1 Tax=Aspergillus sclerotioniger CBS 115572 TaxID=1450535 RepID=A0A317X7Z8_9EURO|nr:beta-lactamase [Aspergillus sclerotioniger CBS 115572]PWY94746.1 beta-lactamase [Aspergillus sclerotioniger CBS 115572]
MAKLQPTAVPRLKAQIDAVTGTPDGIPGVAFAAVNKSGDVIFEHASGKLGFGRPEPMELDSIFWLASCTKLITGIACMQLVEKGVLNLDDVELVERLSPELKAVQVLQDDGTLVPKEREITIRMLLTHTAGFGYSFMNKKLLNSYGARGLDEFTGSYYEILSQPLIHQPGERFEYGINIDWVGLLIERATNTSLNDYFQENIFTPLTIKEINMFPTPAMLSRLCFMNKRTPDGKLSLNEQGHITRNQFLAQTPSERKQLFNHGGHGLFGRPSEYIHILSTLLNDGTHPKTGNKILEKHTVDEMFTNQIPQFPDFGRCAINPPRLDLSNPTSDFYPEPNNPPQGWGLTFFLHVQDSHTHSKGAAWAPGLPNVYWWCDRQRGIGGMIAAQILPWLDKEVLGFWVGLEEAINGAIEEERR